MADDVAVDAAPVADATPAPAPVADAPAPAVVADAAPPADAADAKPADAKPDAPAEPVDYAKALSEVKLPEGMTLDPALTKTGTDVFAKHKISAEAAKDLVTLYAAQQKAGADGNAKAFADQVSGWRAAAEKATTPEERGAAKEAALAVFGKEEMALLDTFGVTNRAGFIKALAKVSKAIKDDAFVPGNAGVINGANDARKQFPKSNMNP